MTELVGRRLGKYEIRNLVGEGGMAYVFKAYHSTLNRSVAIKILKPERNADPAFVEAFVNEARFAAQLNHPHVVTVHDVDEQDGFHYIVMEYVPGQNLQQLLRSQGALPPRLLADLFDQIAEALNYAHRREFVHCDVKPSNILVEPDGRVVLTDFGIARAVVRAKEETQEKRIGSPRYMSPEHVLGKPLSHLSDIYSLGVVLFEMLTGKVPFSGQNSSQVQRAHVSQRPPPPSSVNAALPPAVDQVVARALEKNPQARYLNTLQMARELRMALQAEVLPPPPLPPPPPPPPRRFPWPLLGMGGAVVLLVAAAMFIKRPPAPPPEPTATPTASATHTATQVPATVEILLPTATAAPPLAPTSTLVQTDTPVPPTATPTRPPPTATPTRTATPKGPVYSAPELLEPAEGAGISGTSIPLRWNWAGQLKSGEWFDLWMWPRGEAERALQFVNSSSVDVQPPGGVGVYYWKVRIVRGESGKVTAVLSGWSQSRSLDFKGAPAPPPPSQPTRPAGPGPQPEPEPTPTR